MEDNAVYFLDRVREMKKKEFILLPSDILNFNSEVNRIKETKFTTFRSIFSNKIIRKIINLRVATNKASNKNKKKLIEKFINDVAIHSKINYSNFFRHFF